ncbi:MAG TPA: TPM domain-containing protein [Burkholderiales bacterium]|nr:TPM domain-containing protein [Burkholderiales bacterium]
MNRVAGMLIALCWLAAPAAAQDVAIPYLSGRVVDQAAILSTQARERLAAMLQAHERASGNQIVVLTVPTLRGTSVEDYAVEVFEEWKIGSRELDNGVLILVVPQDRRVRIEIGYGLEGTLSDATASRIIRDLMTPRFREGNYDVGIEAGITAVIQILEGSSSAGADAEWLDPEGKSSGFRVRAPDMPLHERILIGAFVFGIVGLFTFIGLVTPGGMGWFLYFFLIPFWSMFPMFIFGSGAALKILGTYAVLYPVAKVYVSRQSWYRKARDDLKNKGYAEIGGMVIRPGGSSSSGFASGGGFSGGGGRSGGGGASGSW